MILTENNHSVTFMNISLGIYYEMTEEMAQMMMDGILIGEVETKNIMTKSSLNL